MNQAPPFGKWQCTYFKIIIAIKILHQQDNITDVHIVFCYPLGSKQAIFGTNPIALSIPSQEGSVTMDMATAAFALFGVLEAKAAGRPVPDGVAQDSEGRPTTVPDEVIGETRHAWFILCRDQCDSAILQTGIYYQVLSIIIYLPHN